MATKSKVDTKALEQSNNADLSIDQSQANSDVIHLATECFQDLIAVFGTTEYQMENVARQFVQSAEYLKKYKREQLDQREQQLLEAEETNDENRINRASYIKNGIEAEFIDLLRFHASALNAYETMTGKKYEPLPTKKAPPRKVSPMDRLAAARAARGK